MGAPWLCLGVGVLAVALGATATATAGDPVAQAPNVVVVFGDSTTAPRGKLTVYATLLEQAFAAQGRPATVVNAGIPGNTTADGMKRFEKDVVAKNPRLTIIQFGINDAAIDVWKTPPATRPRVSAESYEKNLNHFVERLAGRGVKVVLMTPNPCRWTAETRKLYAKPPYRPDDADGLNAVLAGYTEIVRKAARQKRVTLIDVYAAFEAYGKERGQTMDDLLLDGIHPNSQGHELVANLLLATQAAGIDASAGK